MKPSTIPRYSRFLGAFLAAAAALDLACAQPAIPRFLDEEGSILFLGDSITQGGIYIAYIEAWLYANYPQSRFRIINLGLSSETASGLSEADHPFPRPCIHDRLDRALAAAKPGVTFICYGMNDGIYHPLSEERFAAYRDGMTRLITAVRNAGSKVVLITPSPFDAGTIRLRGGTLNPSAVEEYGYKTPCENYDDVLKAYGRWVLAQKDGVDLVIDIHTPMAQAIARNRTADPSWQSGDGIHPNPAGHQVMARAILEGLAAPGLERLPDYASLPKGDPLAAALGLVLKRHRLLSSAWREHVGHNRPGDAKALPLEEALDEAAKIDTEIRAAFKGLLTQHRG